MHITKIFVLALSCIGLYSLPSFAQTGSGIQDSMCVKRTNALADSLGLSLTQRVLLLRAVSFNDSSQIELDKKNISEEERNQSLVLINNEYKLRLFSLMSLEQWTAYLEFIRRRKLHLLTRPSSHIVRVQEL